jgi:chromosome segregation ATPase
MADAENKEVETSELEQIRKELEETKKKADYLESESKKAFEKRDAYKRQIEETEKKALEEQGKYKELYETKDKEFTEVAKTVEQLKLERDEALNKMTAFEKAQREILTKDLTEDEKALTTKLDLDELSKYVKLVGRTKTDKITNVNSNNKSGYQYDPNSAWKTELNKIQRK